MSEKPSRGTLYLVDGTAQVFRAYFAVRSLSNSQGLATNAVFGFTAMLRKLIRDEKPEYLAVAFDLEGPTFRHEKYDRYKANRPAPPEDLNVQFPYAREVCEVFRIPVLEMPGYEADDLIATCTRQAREAGFDVVVVASDKDLLQLVDSGVVSLNPGKDLRLDEAGVEEQFGVPPRYVRDVLGLMGDAVDNIPGVPGVGEKTAKGMVRTYGGMEPILERAERFASAYRSRDVLLESIHGLEKQPALDGGTLDAVLEARDGFVRDLGALLEIEKDDDMRSRFRSVLDVAEAVDGDGWRAAAGTPGKALGAEVRALRKELKGLDPRSGKKIWLAVHDNRDQAILSRELATLEERAPVEFEPDRFRMGEPDRNKAAALFGALEFGRLSKEFSGPAEDAPGEKPEDEPVYRTVTDRSGLEAEVAACRAAGRFAVDTETDSVDPMRARLVGISLSCRGGDGAYIPIGHDYEGAPEQAVPETVRELLGPLLADPAVGKVGQNIKYDMHVLRRYGMPVRGVVLDTMVAAFLLNSSRSSLKMDSLAVEYLGYNPIPYDEVAGTGKSRKTLNEVEVEAVAAYAAEDADVTLRLAETLEPRLREGGLDGLYRDMDGPLLPVLEAMEARGIRVDPEFLSGMSSEMADSIERLRERIHGLAGTEFNVDSPKQLREILFEKLGLKPGRKTAKGKVPSTDARTLEELSSDHEIAPAILEYRELTKLKGTYVDTLPLLIHPETGRIHTSYNPAGAATGRLSSSDPNLQNIPARSEAGLRIREAFIPEDGHLFLAADYSQMELRVLAHMCGDPGLTEAFRKGEDIHRHTAAQVSGVAPDLVTPTMRRRAKAVNFGIIYGMSEMRLAREQEISRAEARSFIRAYFERFSRVREYIESVREQAKRDAAVRTLFGRVRWFPHLHQRVGRVQKEQALRAAVNTTIQGTAADLMKMAMLRVEKALSRRQPDSRILLQVHDELLLEIPRDDVDAVGGLVREAMEEVHPLEVPLSVDVKTGGNWREVT